MNKKKISIRSAGFVLYAVIALLLFYSYFYPDFYETGMEGIRFWDILFAGKIRAFYTQVFTIGQMQYIPLYDFPMYILFALWNFPLWVVGKVTEIDILHNSFCLMWMKSMMLFFLCIFVIEFRRVIRLLSAPKEDEDEMIFLFLTSGFLMTGMVVLGQYDVICMCFMMRGLYWYLKEDMKKCTLWFALGLPLKYFSLLMYLPLLLLAEKKIHRILLHGIAVMAPCLFFWVVFPYGRPELLEGYVFSPSSLGTNVAKPVYMDLYVRGSIGFGTLFWYILGEVIFLLVCYGYQMKKEDDRAKLAVYVSFMAFAIQFTLAYSHPYWQVIMVPFALLMIWQNRQYKYFGLLLETIYSAGMILGQIFFFVWCFHSGIVGLSLWNRIRTPGEQLDIVTLLGQYVADERLQEYGVGVGITIYTAALLLFIVLYWPLRKKELPVVGAGEECPRWLYFLRALISIVAGMIPLMLYWVQ